ncbi:MAG: hypothetical protein PVH52_05070 [bacterium]|jgi:hypothetical protein
MGDSGRAVIAVLLACAVILGAAFAFYRHSTSPEAVSRRAQEARYAKEQELFTARFDSLKQARLYPTAWRAAPFTKASLDEDRSEWTLTLSLSDWDRRNETSKLDLMAKLYSTFSAVRAQAGGDPEDARLRLEDDDGEILAECSTETGTVIHR